MCDCVDAFLTECEMGVGNDLLEYNVPGTAPMNMNTVQMALIVLMARQYTTTMEPATLFQ